MKTGKLMRTFKSHKDSISSLRITSNKKYLFSGSHDTTIKKWNIETGKLIRSFEDHKNIIHSIAISPNGKYLISGSRDNTIKRWNLTK